MLVLEPAMTEALLARIGTMVDKMQSTGLQPACICSPNIRLAFRRLVESTFPQLVVLSYNEILTTVELVSMGMVRLDDDN
jgi:flagellar biosynthesis protein FlhA